MPQIAKLKLGDQLEKIAKMLNFVTIVGQTRPFRVCGWDADFATVVIADRPLWQSLFAS